MKKIILFNTAIASLNVGDEIIMSSIQNNLEQYLNKNYILQLPVHTPLFHGYQNLLGRSINSYTDVDYKFICGTNLLYTNMFRPMPGMNVNLFNTKLWKDSVLLGVGSGVNSKEVTWYTKMLYSRILSNKYIHSVRDERTKIILEKLGYKVLNTGCPTLWSLSPEHCSTIPTTKADNVIFTLTNYRENIEKDRAMIRILRANYKTLYFWPQSIKDLDYLRKLEEENNINIVPANLNAYRTILSKEIDYVGNRLHGGIFALQNRKRAIILAIDHRARDMKTSFSLPIIERDNVDTELEQLIKSNYSVNINLDYEKINLWKSQFGII